MTFPDSPGAQPPRQPTQYPTGQYPADAVHPVAPSGAYAAPSGGSAAPPHAAGSYDETLHVVPGADHIYHVLDADQTQAEDVMNTTATWFSQKLAPRVHHGH